jgi:hypothetical protein
MISMKFPIHESQQMRKGIPHQHVVVALLTANLDAGKGRPVDPCGFVWKASQIWKLRTNTQLRPCFGIPHSPQKGPIGSPFSGAMAAPPSCLPQLQARAYRDALESCDAVEDWPWSVSSLFTHQFARKKTSVTKQLTISMAHPRRGCKVLRPGSGR